MDIDEDALSSSICFFQRLFPHLHSCLPHFYAFFRFLQDSAFSLVLASGDEGQKTMEQRLCSVSCASFCYAISAERVC